MPPWYGLEYTGGMKKAAALGCMGMVLVSATFSAGLIAATLSHAASSHAAGCEVSVIGSTFCLMSPSDTAALAGTFSQAQPSLYFLTALAAPLLLSGGLALLRPRRLHLRETRRAYAEPIAPYTLLFARGILNPKAP